MNLYNISGLRVSSEIVLPGLAETAVDDGRPDVTVRRRPVPKALPGVRAAGPTWQIDGKRLLLHVPDVARFLLSDGHAIDFEAAPGADDADIPVFLLGTVFGILLHQREQVVLHASAVRVAGKAVLFCGPSGTGKSTLAAALMQCGHAVMADDLCAIAFGGDGTPIVHPDGCRLRLWAQTIERLALTDRRGARLRANLQKFYVEPAEIAADALPLGAIYALREARPPHVAGIERPNVVDTALLLRRSAYRPLLIDRLAQRPSYFHAAAAVANKVGIFYLTRPLGFPGLPDVVAGLEAHWREIGLTEKTP